MRGIGWAILGRCGFLLPIHVLWDSEISVFYIATSEPKELMLGGYTLAGRHGMQMNAAVVIRS